MNYKKLILNEYRVAKENMLNNPFSARLHNRFFNVAKIYRKSSPKRYGMDCKYIRDLYQELTGVR